MKFNFDIKKIIFATILIYASSVFAQEVVNEDKISFPIAELGNCTNKDVCKTYCDQPSNLAACLDFAEKNKLMSESELRHAKKFLSVGLRGPGGCVGQESCRQYCDEINHIDECVTFAEDNGLLAYDELEDARKVKSAINKGIKLPACKNKRECDSYCSDPNNMEECIQFAEAAGFLHDAELQEAKKVLVAIKNGVKPPPCKGRQACEEYCTQENHIDECVTFAQAAGLIAPEELEMIKKTGGRGPGGCRGREACEQYCKDNTEICTNFALEHGFIKPEEAEAIKKTGGKGPGGCVGREECESFCNDPSNQETCFSFAKDNRFMPEDDIEKMNHSRDQLKGAVLNMPSEVRDCLKNTIGEEVLTKLDNGTFLPNREIGEKMRGCFENIRPHQQIDGQMPPPNNMPHPDGYRPPENFRPDGEYNRPSENYIPHEEYQVQPENNPQPNEYNSSYPSAMPPGEYTKPENYQQMPSEYQRPPEGYEYQRPEGYQLPPGDYNPENYQVPPANYQPSPEYQEYNLPPPLPPSEPQSLLYKLNNKLAAFLFNFLFP